jgi:RHH-type rel operon transcriptional repressor/antitoxin RelB
MYACITENPAIFFRAPSEIHDEQEHFVKMTKHDKADLLLPWLEETVSLEELQIQEVEAGIKEADAGMFASPAETERVLNKWQ